MEALQHVREEAETRQGELAVRNVKMVDQEVEARLLELRRNILEEQRNKLSEENQSLTSDMVWNCTKFSALISPYFVM